MWAAPMRLQAPGAPRRRARWWPRVSVSIRRRCANWLFARPHLGRRPPTTTTTTTRWPAWFRYRGPSKRRRRRWAAPMRLQAPGAPRRRARWRRMVSVSRRRECAKKTMVQSLVGLRGPSSRISPPSCTCTPCSPSSRTPQSPRRRAGIRPWRPGGVRPGSRLGGSPFSPRRTKRTPRPMRRPSSWPFLGPARPRLGPTRRARLPPPTTTTTTRCPAWFRYRRRRNLIELSTL
mmetsp:Transcript_78186/g.253818  ORF Transcript_78186/g.253818 Transcript_78186/m.253818 type:complete len:233 (-) Transcript_78186:247-945(-)